MVEADEWLQGRVASIDVEGRTKSVHSTWRKMQRRELSKPTPTPNPNPDP